LKNLYIIILILIVIFCSGFDDPIINIAVSYQPNVEKLETLFKSVLPENKGIIYTKVPRGLIISIDEKYFFNDGEARIKESSLCILDIIIANLRSLNNYCVVESHTENNNFENSDYNEDWEISVSRSANIVEYMMKYGKLPREQLFALGFGEFMPFRDNVSVVSDLDKRIDFVILEYEAKR